MSPSLEKVSTPEVLISLELLHSEAEREAYVQILHDAVLEKLHKGLQFEMTEHSCADTLLRTRAC
jgi:hypothetical protein